MTGKERMIHILLLLKQNTGDNRHLTTAEIVRHFTDMGVPTDRGTVKNDIDTMIACGIDIVANKGTQIKYSYVDHPFDLAELKLLIDAVEASRFITAGKSASLGGTGSYICFRPTPCSTTRTDIMCWASPRHMGKSSHSG